MELVTLAFCFSGGRTLNQLSHSDQGKRPKILKRKTLEQSTFRGRMHALKLENRLAELNRGQ